MNRIAWIEEHLGRPYFSTDGCAVYNVDCLDAMRLLQGDSPFALTVTSPPYNIGKEYEDRRPLEDYLTWTEEWIREVHRLTEPAGALALNLGYVELPGRAKAIPLPYLVWQSVPFYLVQEIIWNYGAGVASRRKLSPRNEKWLWYVKSQDQYTFNLDDIRDPNVKYPRQFKNGKLKVNPLGKNPTDVWTFPKVTSGKNRSSKERTPHPAQFPEAVVERFIKGMSNVDDIIFDPFLGSGTTAAVALSAGRQVVGFEIDPSYCALAARRIELTLERGAQQSLLAAGGSAMDRGSGASLQGPL